MPQSEFTRNKESKKKTTYAEAAEHESLQAESTFSVI